MLTKAILAVLYPRAAQAHLDAFAAKAPEVLAGFGLTKSDNRLHFFLAQIGHESGGLTIVEENMNYRAERIAEVWPKRFASAAAAKPFERNPEKLANNVYANRMGNGPPESGDGFRFRGRGYIQITGRDGYRNVGDIAKLPLEANPDMAAAPEHALLVACAFWQWKGLNAHCDAADFEKVTRLINGGLVGLADRRAWLDKVRRSFAVRPDAAHQPAAADAIAIQRALIAKGFTEVGAADGDIGPRTIAAITRFRHKNGLPAGLIDNRLRAALGVPAA
jgi:putative chitinase